MKIDISQHGDLSKYLAIGLKRAIHDSALSTAQHIVADINTEIIPNEPRPPVDRGIYKAGWRVDDQEKQILIVNNAKHTPFIELGVRPENVQPSRMMIIALAAWVKRKGLVGSPKTEIAAGKKTQSQVRDETNAAAWAIAMSMRKKGIFNGSGSPSGLRILRRAMLKFVKYFQVEFARELKKVKR